MSETNETLGLARAQVDAAAATLGPRIRRTPIMTVDGSELGVEGLVTLKLEHLQHAGSFKARGALHFLLTNEISAAGVTAASGGNHGVAVAWAAAQLGHRATIFVPTISSPAKVDRLRSLDAEVIQTGSVYAEALAVCRDHQATSGATAVHAYEAADVMAGAGTTGRELAEQLIESGWPTPDRVLVACGGGGLVGGVAAWLEATTSIVACETEGTAALTRALEAGEPVDVEVSGVAADALGATRIGSLAFDTLRAAGATTAVVDDDAVVAARRNLWDRFRLLVEPSAAVPLAALEAGRVKTGPGDHTAVIICGANTQLTD